MCKLSTNISGECEFSVGGIKKIYISTFNEFLFENLIFNSNKTQIFEIKNLEYLDLNFLPFDLEDAAEVRESKIGDLFEHTLLMSFPRMTAPKQRRIKDLRKAKLVAIVQDKNNQYWIIGVDTPLKNTEYSAGTGTASGENVYNIIFKSIAYQQMYSISESVVENIAESTYGNEFDDDEFSDDFN